MEDTDHVCPLCCEELDISDREFYPCKCGYQVCMWCWHRIRESESGLCPACRTPYGEDPHQFSAVDVEEVLKANKEKEAAAKRERQRLQHSNDDGGGGGAGGGGGGGETGMMEVPKDRTQLANMRVIRRNLVYAVGLPPNLAMEETLRKPEYFGQYGKISKIVLNRTQAQPGGDPRRASASAYVTFVHKEDTLSCILALDGFYMENRNVRASYGTSKYCSAFIKNVRCNNPECTYLHEMGATEDTFTKQEIQAGYVTSGRDVLARQQQIVAEQMRSGVPGIQPRKKAGGGGPSGTGKACANHVFPVPEYDEPSRPSPPLVPPPAGMARSTTAPPVSLNPSNISAKLGRSNSVTTGSGRSPTLASQAAPAATAAMHRKSHSAGVAGPGAGPAGTTATAAEVVASGRPKKPEAAEAHATLTPLTPIKRAAKPTAARSASVGAGPAISNDPLRNGTNKNKQNGVKSATAAAAATTGLTGAPAMPSTQQQQQPTSSNAPASVSSIGGDVIGPPKLKPRTANVLTGIAGGGGDPVGPSLGSLGGRPISLNAAAAEPAGGVTRSSALGGEVFTGLLPSSSGSAIGSSMLHSSATSGLVGGVSLSAGPVLSAGSPGAGLWNAPGGSVLSSRAPGPPSAAAPDGSNNTSALASLLGINLPTGSGSLQENSNLWSAAPSPPAQPSPLSALNSSAVPTQDMFGGGGGGGRDYGGAGVGSSSIGGVPIGGTTSAPGTIGGGNKTDIALLQSLLPGVHITSGSDPMAFGGMGGGGGWNGGGSGGAPGGAHPQGFGPGGLNGDVIGGGSLGGGVAAPGSGIGAGIGAIGQNVGTQSQRRGPGIW